MKIIYEPKGAAREYARLALNPYRGCTHGCIYCYNNGRHSKKGVFFESARPRTGLMGNLIKDCQQLRGGNVPEIQMSFLGDVYQPAEKALGITRMIVGQLISFNLPFTILTKSSLVERDFDLLTPYPLFRLGFSFTSIDQTEVTAWEPGTGYVIDRISSLKKFKNNRTKTWVSLEPVMSVSSTINVIKEIHRFVDFFWIGALNHMDPPEPIDLVDAHREIMAALEFRRCKYAFKSSFGIIKCLTETSTPRMGDSSEL